MAITSPELMFFAEVYPYKMGIGQRREMISFSGIFPKRGRGPQGSTQGTGPLVTRAGDGNVPVKMVGSRSAGPDSTFPYSQCTHKEQGTYLERETPRTPEEIVAEEAETKIAKEHAKAKRKQAKAKAAESSKRPREKTDTTEASKRQREDTPLEGPITEGAPSADNVEEAD